ncbi:hypothetical protein [Natrialba swarupiae]|uniref:Uncharacterized protein n=1 Tax=Natrialba swarupiae TaxID=2448032 RepID=A0A5D5APQ6_9EURY|nr:hypothetical protein [Natrialba swarupiae]MCW8171891.1 hypothetical protein [Natrialba swarupiae]TYT63818.1 hypothetical protein FYC77_00930 [Natrialba swarupiae]
MSSADSSVSDDTSRWYLLGVAVVFVLLGSSALLRTPSLVSPTTAVGVVAVLAGLVAVLLWRRPGPGAGVDSAGTDSSDDDASDSGVWNAIPRWQYEGRHVESGGLARGEQEQALADIQRQADELSDDPDRK